MRPVARRLPGIRFNGQPAPAADVLPRMDVAGFAGFASSGPLHLPVAVEDPAHFAAVFGPDARLAWDVDSGSWRTAELGPAVRAFLRNGGQRCWVVRLADHTAAQPDSFALAGILEAIDTPDGIVVRPARAWARSEGSWADGVQVNTSLTIDARAVQHLELGDRPDELRVQVTSGLRIGDLLRLRYVDAATVAYVAVEGALAGATYFGRAVWFGVYPPSADATGSPPTAAWQATWFAGPSQRTAPALLATTSDPEMLQVSLATSLADAPPRGVLLRIVPQSSPPGPGPVWMIAGDATPASADGLAAVQAVSVSGPALVSLPSPASLPPGVPVCERLSLALRASAPPSALLALDNLDFVPGAPRYWGALPTDAELFATGPSPDATGAATLGAAATPAARERRTAYALLWQAAANPRFPLAGNTPQLTPDAIAESQPPLFTFPLAATGLPSFSTPAGVPGGDALERDGLASFSRTLFLDADLVDALSVEVMGRADTIRYLAPVTRGLRGVHALLALDEVTLVAAPDATQRAWQPGPPHAPRAPIDPPPMPAPDWGTFLECGLHLVPRPVMQPPAVDPSGTISLSWSGTADRFVLEEATQPDFSDASVLHTGPETEWTIFGRSLGDYYYHVRAIQGGASSDWSAGVVASIMPRTDYQIPALAGPQPPVFDLLSIQRGLLRMCAARGDLFAILSLPAHFREADAIEHVGRLRPSSAPVFRPGASPVDLPLTFGETAVLSYGALYHPWLIGQDADGQFQRSAPDGAICGTLARRALARGAWIAPANELLSGLVALTPPIDATRRLDLQEAQINLVRQEPYGFVTLSTDTLSQDPDLLQINVRRLLQLLRRLALRLGASSVFEPQNDAFVRRVRREAESALGLLFGRGAFAGATPDTAYQIVFRSTPEDVDQGRFIVDLRVAPALPMQFLTVRLVQSGGRTAISEER